MAGALWSTAALRQRREVRGQELMYFPSGRMVELMALGDRHLAADLVWLRAIQYYGRHRMTDQKYTHIGHIFDIATQLDPRFVNAYLFGGIVQAADGADFEGALRLMKRGIAHNPDDYLLPFETGFLYHVERRDYEAAAYYYRRALAAPNCPEIVKRFAAFAMTRADRPDVAVRLWEDLAAESSNAAIQRLAAARAAELRAQLEGGWAD